MHQVVCPVGCAEPDDRRPGPVADADEFLGVLCGVAVTCDHQGDRLPRVADLAVCQHVAGAGMGEVVVRDEQRQPAAHGGWQVLVAHGGDHSRMGAGAVAVDHVDLGCGVGAADDGAAVGRGVEVVGEAAAAGEQPVVLGAWVAGADHGGVLLADSVRTDGCGRRAADTVASITGW